MKKQKTKSKSTSEKFAAFLKHPFIRKNEPMLHTVEWVFILLAFFAVGFPLFYFQSTGNRPIGNKLQYSGDLSRQAPPTEAEKKFIGETVTEPVADVTGWDTYKNQWYGFEIKHPSSWTNMQYKSATTKDARYETIYKFRKSSNREDDPYVGFDVAVYSTKKVSGIENTNDIQKKADASEDTSNCHFSEDMSFDQTSGTFQIAGIKKNNNCFQPTQLFSTAKDDCLYGMIPAPKENEVLDLGGESSIFQKVSVKEDNACYEPAYFFSTMKNNYLYDIIPIAKEDADTPSDLEQDVNKNFPEYKKVVGSLKMIPVVRPKAVVPAKPRITAPRPVSAKVVVGRLACAKKNDKPGKSQNGNKPGHMDMECCLDPDETPNPWCDYTSSKYQKYLK